MEPLKPSRSGPHGLALCCGTGAAMLCCAAPVIAVGLGAAGLAAWLQGVDVVLIPMVALIAGALTYVVARRRRRPAKARTTTSP